MSDENWSLIIKPKSKLLDLHIPELIRYRELVFLLVWRDFKTLYTQTILGPLWYLLNPLFSTIVYTFIFGNMARIGTNGIPHLLFYYSGTMLWTFFSTIFMDCSNVLISNQHLFGKIYFPRFAVPISYMFSNAIRSGIQFFLLLIFLAYYLINGMVVYPSRYVILFPLLFVWIGIIGMGMGLIISSLTTKYRDLKNMVVFAINLLMYATPVVYPLSEIPSGFAWIQYFNPLSAPIELFRIFFFRAGFVPLNLIITSLLITASTTILGLILFNHTEKTFIDII